MYWLVRSLVMPTVRVVLVMVLFLPTARTLTLGDADGEGAVGDAPGVAVAGDADGEGAAGDAPGDAVGEGGVGDAPGAVPVGNADGEVRQVMLRVWASVVMPTVRALQVMQWLMVPLAML